MTLLWIVDMDTIEAEPSSREAKDNKDNNEKEAKEKQQKEASQQNGTATEEEQQTNGAKSPEPPISDDVREIIMFLSVGKL